MPKVPPNNSDIDRQIHTSITSVFPTATCERRLTEYYVVAPRLSFYKLNKHGRYVKDTASLDTPAIARRGDAFTGSLVFTSQQTYVDLGFNTFLPLTDVHSGDVLLQTKRTIGSGKKRKRP